MDLLVSKAPADAGQAIIDATSLLQQMTSNAELDEFLTLPAYTQLKD